MPSANMSRNTIKLPSLEEALQQQDDYPAMRTAQYDSHGRFHDACLVPRMTVSESSSHSAASVPHIETRTSLRDASSPIARHPAINWDSWLIQPTQMSRQSSYTADSVVYDTKRDWPTNTGFKSRKQRAGCRIRKPSDAITKAARERLNREDHSELFRQIEVLVALLFGIPCKRPISVSNGKSSGLLFHKKNILEVVHGLLLHFGDNSLKEALESGNADLHFDKMRRVTEENQAKRRMDQSPTRGTLLEGADAPLCTFRGGSSKCVMHNEKDWRLCRMETREGIRDYNIEQHERNMGRYSQ